MSLVEQNVLVLEQVKTLSREEFPILGADGSPAATVHIDDSPMSRLFRGSRDMTITENGRPVLTITDTSTISDGAGAALATLTRHNGLFSTAVSIQMSDGALFDCKGPLAGFDFTISMGERVAGRFARQLPGVSPTLMGDHRYVLSLDPALPPAYRGALLGATIAVDVIHDKQISRRSHPA